MTELKFTMYPPAKINIHLAIGARRPDGFHSLESIFIALDFADVLEFSFSPDNKNVTTVGVREGDVLAELAKKGQVFTPFPMKNNIVYLAVELFRKKTGFSGDVHIELTKRIPPGSGLGGGSSDAAATLLALNGLPAGFGGKGEALSGETLLDLAAQLGSDVPFFVEIALRNGFSRNISSARNREQNPGANPAMAASPARAVSGRGEFFRYLPPPPPLGVLLAFPGFASHTAPAFRLLDEKRPVAAEPKSAALGPENSVWDCPQNWRFSNDFEALFLNHGTEQEKEAYSTILNDLRQAGALYTSLSGSGSACFGVFSSPEAAEQAGKQFAGAFYVLKDTFFLRAN